MKKKKVVYLNILVILILINSFQSSLSNKFFVPNLNLLKTIKGG
jgi:hypothetical protein